MFIPSFNVNQVVIDGVVAGTQEAGNDTGYLLINMNESQFYVFFDYAPTWAEVANLEPGTPIEVVAAIKSGHNDSFVAQRVNTGGLHTSLTGYIANPQMKEAQGKRLMEFSVRVPSKDIDGNDTTEFHRCSCWNEKLFAKIVKGAFVAITGNARIRYYEHNGEHRSSVDISVNHLSTPFISSNEIGRAHV